MTFQLRHKSNPRRIVSMLLGAALLSLGPAGVQAAGTQIHHPEAVTRDSARLDQMFAGVEVESIRNVESISEWRTLGAQHLTLRINHQQDYLLTLNQPCAQLNGARLVGVSMTNQEIWADFDYIAADGWECRIDTITRLGV